MMIEFRLFDEALRFSYPLAALALFVGLNPHIRHHKSYRRALSRHLSACQCEVFCSKWLRSILSCLLDFEHDQLRVALEHFDHNILLGY